MKKKQDGFSSIVLLLAVFVLVILAGAGWRIYELKKEPSDIETKPSSSTIVPAKQKVYTDTANRFTLGYPAEWTTFFPEKTGTEGRIKLDSDWAKVSRPVLLKPSQGQKDNNVSVTPGCETVSLDAKPIGVVQNLKDRKDRFHTQKDLKINGHNAFYDKLDFKSDAESYLHHTYIVLDKGECVEIAYRENWHHDMSNTNFDDSKNISGFRSIVESIKFLN